MVVAVGVDLVVLAVLSEGDIPVAVGVVLAWVAQVAFNAVKSVHVGAKRATRQVEEERNCRHSLVRNWLCRKHAWLGGGDVVEGQLTMLASQSAVELVKAVVLSQIGSHAALKKLLAADSVAEWDGWTELENGGTEEMCLALAARLLRLAGDDSAVVRADDERQEGLFHSVASAHGRNNCLLDLLILCLRAEGDIPKHLAGHVQGRKWLVDACRAMLVTEVGAAAGDIDAGRFPYT